MKNPEPLGPVIKPNETRYWTCRCGNSSFLIRADGCCKCTCCGNLAESVRIAATIKRFDMTELRVIGVRKAKTSGLIMENERFDVSELS